MARQAIPRFDSRSLAGRDGKCPLHGTAQRSQKLPANLRAKSKRDRSDKKALACFHPSQSGSQPVSSDATGRVEQVEVVSQASITSSSPDPGHIDASIENHLSAMPILYASEQHKRLPHLFISAKALPAHPSYYGRLCGFLSRGFPFTLMLDGAGWYVIFEDTDAARLRLWALYVERNNVRFCGEFLIVFDPFITGINNPAVPSTQVAELQHRSADDSTTAVIQRAEYASELPGLVPPPVLSSVCAERDDMSSSGRPGSDHSLSKIRKCHVCAGAGTIFDPLVSCNACPRRYHKRCHEGAPTMPGTGSASEWLCRSCKKKLTVSKCQPPSSQTRKRTLQTAGSSPDRQHQQLQTPLGQPSHPQFTTPFGSASGVHEHVSKRRRLDTAEPKSLVLHDYGKRRLPNEAVEGHASTDPVLVSHGTLGSVMGSKAKRTDKDARNHSKCQSCACTVLGFPGRIPICAKCKAIQTKQTTPATKHDSQLCENLPAQSLKGPAAHAGHGIETKRGETEFHNSNVLSHLNKHDHRLVQKSPVQELVKGLVTDSGEDVATESVEMSCNNYDIPSYGTTKTQLRRACSTCRKAHKRCDHLEQCLATSMHSIEPSADQGLTTTELSCREQARKSMPDVEARPAESSEDTSTSKRGVVSANDRLVQDEEEAAWPAHQQSELVKTQDAAQRGITQKASRPVDFTAMLEDIIKTNSERREYSVTSLFEAFPEARPERAFDKAAKLEEIKRRPKRKERICQRATNSSLQPLPFMRQPSEPDNADTDPDNIAFEVVQSGERRVRSLQEFLGIPDNPMAVIRDGQLAYRDGTLNKDGEVPRAKTYFTPSIGRT